MSRNRVSRNGERMTGQVSEPGFFERYWDGRLRAAGGLQGVGHGSRSQEYNTWTYRLKRVAFRRALRRLDVPLASARVLDIGSGLGFGVDRWREAGAGSVSAADITPFAVERLRARYPDVDVRRLDIGAEDVPLEPASFDVVSAFEVLFHIVDDERYARAVANIARTMRPGGYFLFTDNFVRHARHAGKYQVSRTDAEIRQALEDAGLEVVARYPVFVLMGFPVDTAHERVQRWWRSSVGRLARDERRGRYLGAALYGLDRVLTRVSRQGPSVELLVARRPVA